MRVSSIKRYESFLPSAEGILGTGPRRLDGGMMMLGSARPGAHEPGISLIVKDADAVYQRAMAAGAEIVEEIGDKPYGGRGFVCSDLEGKIFYVVTYNPWAAK